jgi:hypothetical protein
MRDLISKLDAIVNETALKDKEDLQAKRKALQDLQMDPNSKDPEITQAIMQRKTDLEKEAKSKGFAESFEIGDEFGISFSEDHEIATTIVDILEDGIVIELDDTALDMLTNEGLHFLEGELVEDKQKGVDGKACWKGYKRMGTKQKGGKTVDNCVKIGEDLDESGLQRYTGIKKYGKDGFEALQKAGREGADEEEKGRIKDKYLKKEDHSPSNPEYDDEAGMADNNLETLKRAVVGLDDLIHAGDNLPEWCQEKIAVAKSMLVNVWDYMQSEENVDEAGSPAQQAAIAINMKKHHKKPKSDEVDEAKYQGREVPLGKKMAGDVKKSKVYVRKPNGNIVKVNFGDKKMRIKKSNPARRKSFRARHNCKNPGPRWKARYWSCRSW